MTQPNDPTEQLAERMPLPLPAGHQLQGDQNPTDGIIYEYHPEPISESSQEQWERLRKIISDSSLKPLVPVESQDRVAARVRVTSIRYFGQTRSGMRLDDIVIRMGSRDVEVGVLGAKFFIPKDYLAREGFNSLFQGCNLKESDEGKAAGLIVDWVLAQQGKIDS